MIDHLELFSQSTEGQLQGATRPTQGSAGEAARTAQTLPKEAADFPFKGYHSPWDCIDMERPQNSGQYRVLVDPRYKSTRQAGFVHLGEPNSKLLTRFVDGSKLFQAGIKALEWLLHNGWDCDS